MTKKKDQDTNIIQFPNLKDRLLDKGMNEIQNRNYKQALSLLLQAEQLDQEHSEIKIGLVVCLLELGELEEAKAICKKMLKEDLGDYFHVLEIYLTILLQLSQYEEVQQTIEAVIEEGTVPQHYEESFKKMLEFSTKINVGGKEDYDNQLEDSHSLTINIDKLFQDESNIKEQWNIIQSLKERNIRKYVPELAEFLKGKNYHPVLKTMILHLLIENEVNSEITVNKFDQTLTVIPSDLSPLTEGDFIQKVIKILEDKIGHENPSLFEVMKEILIRHLYVLFPFNPENDNAELWACALHVYGCELHGIEAIEEEIVEMYKLSKNHVIETIDRIKEIEKISFLQI
ncbi:tetratricopeptide repeat protein [Bacillus timonensis]|nr:tetratricopeptide repeat protein [Bacillus timonensis]